MIRLTVIPVLCLSAFVLLGCSGGRSEITNRDGANRDRTESISLGSLSDRALSEEIDFDVETGADGTTVVIGLSKPTTEAFGAIIFDPIEYSPASVEWVGGDFAIKLAIADVFGEVPFGAAGIDGAKLNSGTLLVVKFEPGPQTMARRTSSAPSGNDNVVNDLVAEPQEDGRVKLSWTERNLGDYDLNGEVGISDITPIALNYLAVVDDSLGDDEWEAIIDGDNSGEIGISDITPIALNYLTVLSGYRVYRGVELAGGEVSWSPTPVKTVNRTAPSQNKANKFTAYDDPGGE